MFRALVLLCLVTPVGGLANEECSAQLSAAEGDFSQAFMRRVYEWSDFHRMSHRWPKPVEEEVAPEVEPPRGLGWLYHLAGKGPYRVPKILLRSGRRYGDDGRVLAKFLSQDQTRVRDQTTRVQILLNNVSELSNILTYGKTSAYGGGTAVEPARAQSFVDSVVSEADQYTVSQILGALTRDDSVAIEIDRMLLNEVLWVWSISPYRY